MLWGGGAGEKKRLQYFEFGLQYLVQPLGVNPTYSTFNISSHMLKFLQPFEFIEFIKYISIKICFSLTNSLTSK